jgi:hypothetical protein
MDNLGQMFVNSVEATAIYFLALRYFSLFSRMSNQNFEIVLGYPACRLDKPSPRFVWVSVAKSIQLIS